MVYSGIFIALALCVGAWRSSHMRTPIGTAAAMPLARGQAGSGAAINAVMIGHEFRQDDLPQIAASPDGSLWVAWLSWVGTRDDVAIRHYNNGTWSSLLWVPGTSGDSWLPQVGVDASNRVWAVWSQQADGNWDLYARRFDPAAEEWGSLERLTSDPLPDINPRLASDGKGNLAVVWQGFRGKASNIFLKQLRGDRWGEDVRVTNREADDWEPAAAFDSKGNIWVAYDSYKNGNYDVFASRITHGAVDGGEMAVATTPLFDARATVAVDTQDRVWVAWEQGAANWGKDFGYEVRNAPPGAPLGGHRIPRIRCYVNGQWKEPQANLAAAFPNGNETTYQPHVFSDGKGSVWVAAKPHLMAPAGEDGAGHRGYWEYWMTHLEANQWSKAFALPDSKGRSSTRIGAVLDKQARLWAVWPSDHRKAPFYHRPRHQQVYAAMIPSASEQTAVVWKSGPDETVTAKLAHPDEPGDLRAIRSYSADVDGSTMHIVRGDFHRHTELSWDGGGTTDGNLQDFYRYMIDAASMDFGASTDHQGGAWPYWWWYSQKMTDMYRVPGKYTPIFGYERSAVYPNGHRNVLFARRSDSHVTPFHLKDGAKGFEFPLGAMGDEPGIGTGELVQNDTKLLYEDIRGRHAIDIPHTSATRMGTDWRDNDPDLEPVVEIFQGCRASSEQLGAPFAYDPKKDAGLIKRAGYFPAGFVSNAWAKGYRLGIIASSDHNSTHISYALVYTDDRTRQGVLDAIRKRHTYGAMDNIIMDVRMGEHFMGDEFALSKSEPIRVKLRGTRTIAKVDIIKDSQVIYSVSPKQQNVEFEFTDTGDVHGRHYYYVRVQQENLMLAWSSPFFINFR